MYYISEIKQDLEDYNTLVSQGENYQETTLGWSKTVKHYNQELYAIIKHPNYSVEALATVDNLDGWYDTNNKIE